MKYEYETRSWWSLYKEILYWKGKLFSQRVRVFCVEKEIKLHKKNHPMGNKKDFLIEWEKGSFQFQCTEHLKGYDAIYVLNAFELSTIYHFLNEKISNGVRITNLTDGEIEFGIGKNWKKPT